MFCFEMLTSNLDRRPFKRLTNAIAKFAEVSENAEERAARGDEGLRPDHR
jgi:hypothetical protein